MLASEPTRNLRKLVCFYIQIAGYIEGSNPFNPFTAYVSAPQIMDQKFISDEWNQRIRFQPVFIFRLKNFCGSIADSVQSKTNKLHIRYFAEAVAINSSFVILYTAYRDKGTAGELFFWVHRVLRRLIFNLFPWYLQPSAETMNTIVRIKRA